MVLNSFIVLMCR